MKLLFTALGCLFFASCSSLPPVAVNDTDSAKGRLGFRQRIEFADLVKFHGHPCDGLLEGMQALQLGLSVLYPDGIIDRTNTRVVSKSSPCLTDAAIYLTGGRFQYGSFYVDERLPGLYAIQRTDNGHAVLVKRNEGVKPPEIDRLGSLAVQRKLSPEQLDHLSFLENEYLEYLKKTPPEKSFSVVFPYRLSWNPILKGDYVKTDIINKDQPRSSRKSSPARSSSSLR